MPSNRMRERNYPYQKTVSLASEDGASLERAADRYGIAVGVLIRRAFRRGWASEQESLRKARRQSSGNGASA